MKKAAFALHLCCQNDTNGNPRRIFVVYDGEAGVIKVFDEGYGGEAEFRAEFPGVPLTGRIATTPSERQGFLRWERERRGK
jgi:hypothetical protein